MLSSTFYDGQGFWLAQKLVKRTICVVAERAGAGAAAGSASGAVAVGGRQPGDPSRAGVA